MSRASKARAAALKAYPLPEFEGMSDSAGANRVGFEQGYTAGARAALLNAADQWMIDCAAHRQETPFPQQTDLWLRNRAGLADA